LLGGFRLSLFSFPLNFELLVFFGLLENKVFKFVLSPQGFLPLLIDLLHFPNSGFLHFS
jgi:hypothetical protein